MRIDVAGRTDTGLVRPRNEDALLFDLIERDGEAAALLVVADGLGGLLGGDRASAAAVESIRRSRIEPDDASLRAAVAAADAAVRAIPEGEPMLLGASTTLVIGLVERGVAWIAHVGDSRAYLVRGADGAGGVRIERLTRDHSWVQEQVDAGRIPLERADSHPERNVVTRALGLPGASEPDATRCPLAQGDWLLLCTDGLTEAVDEPSIAKTVQSSRTAEEAAEALVQRALAGGAPDNVTVALAYLVP